MDRKRGSYYMKWTLEESECIFFCVVGLELFFTSYLSGQVCLAKYNANRASHDIKQRFDLTSKRKPAVFGSTYHRCVLLDSFTSNRQIARLEQMTSIQFKYFMYKGSLETGLM